jgi:hypothetical protein
MKMLQVTLEGKKGDYYWTLGRKDEEPVAASASYPTVRELKADLVAFIRAVQQNDFEVCGDKITDAPSLSEVSSVVRLPLRTKVAWQVASKHGWSMTMYAEVCPCKNGETMTLFERHITVGTLSFEIDKHNPSPVGCDVYVVGPAKAAEPLSKDRKMKDTA